MVENKNVNSKGLWNKIAEHLFVNNASYSKQCTTSYQNGAVNVNVNMVRCYIFYKTSQVKGLLWPSLFLWSKTVKRSQFVWEFSRNKRMIHRFIIFENVSHKLRTLHLKHRPKNETATFKMRHENGKKQQENGSPKIQTVRLCNEKENALSLRMAHSKWERWNNVSTVNLTCTVHCTYNVRTWFNPNENGLT